MIAFIVFGAYFLALGVADGQDVPLVVTSTAGAPTDSIAASSGPDPTSPRTVYSEL